MSKKPWICGACRSMVRTRSAPGGGDQVGHEPGADGHPGLVLAVLAGVAEVGNHRRHPPAGGPPTASSSSSSSSMFSAGGMVGWTMKTSVPRMFSWILIWISPSEKRLDLDL